MPINYLKSLKPSAVKLSSLPKLPVQTGRLGKDNTLVTVFDIHYKYMNYDSLSGLDNLSSIDFAIKNLSNYPIKNLKVFFVYKNFWGEIVSYSLKEIKDTILPQLALQFSHSHYVKYFRIWEPPKAFGAGVQREGFYREGAVEIRILDYQIDRTGKSSPADLLFK
jgi:hypothetical protein